MADFKILDNNSGTLLRILGMDLVLEKIWFTPYTDTIAGNKYLIIYSENELLEKIVIKSEKSKTDITVTNQPFLYAYGPVELVGSGDYYFLDKYGNEL